MLQTVDLTSHGIRIQTLIAAGIGPAVLLLHGNSASKEIFAGQFASLIDAGALVVAPDLPGHGSSENAREPEKTYSIPALAKLLFDLLDQLGVVETHIVGWSLGGHVALEMVARTPARVRSATITGTPPISSNPDSVARAFIPSQAAALAGKLAWSDDETRQFAMAALGEPQGVPPELYAAFRRADGRARSMIFHNALTDPSFDQGEIVRTMAVPLAVIHGARDTLVNLAYLRSLPYRALWRESPIVVDNAGHAPHWEKSDHFDAILLEFLAEQDMAFAV